jgi:hypothetical protein
MLNDLAGIKGLTFNSRAEELKTNKMDQAMLSAVRAGETGATGMKRAIDATALSRFKIEHALDAPGRRRLPRHAHGFKPIGLPKTARLARELGSCDILDSDEDRLTSLREAKTE